jgi:hypothetical protein
MAPGSLASSLTQSYPKQPFRRASEQPCDGPDRSNRDGEHPIGNWSIELDLQMGNSSANAIRASGLSRLHNRSDIRLQPCLLIRHTQTPLAIREAPI